MKFSKNYFVLTVLLLFTEVLIALFIHDRFIRPHLGDVLVVMLIYCFLKSFFNLSVWTAAVSVLIFSFCVECSQYLHLIDKLGLQNSGIARAVFGNSFSWIDCVSYVLGIGCVIIIEKRHFKNRN